MGDKIMCQAKGIPHRIAPTQRVVNKKAAHRGRTLGARQLICARPDVPARPGTGSAIFR
ncbi:MAG: hypothetical protein GWP17_03395 [Aquificales bacterium]|nr:hypothetical protein [Aquificales bacterium]